MNNSKRPFGCYYIKRDYIDFLRANDNEHVPRADYTDDNRAEKFYCGPVFTEDGVDYFVPVSHETDKGEMVVYDKDINIREPYGLYLRTETGKIIGNVDFRYRIPCQDDELLTPCRLKGFGALQEKACKSIENRICTVAKNTHNNIKTNAYPWLTQTAVKDNNSNDSMWAYEDLKNEFAEPVSDEDIDFHSTDAMTDNTISNPETNIPSASTFGTAPKGYLAQRFAKIDTSNVSKQNIVKTTDRQPGED